MPSFTTLLGLSGGPNNDHDVADDFRHSLLAHTRLHQDVHSAIPPKRLDQIAILVRAIDFWLL